MMNATNEYEEIDARNCDCKLDSDVLLAIRLARKWNHGDLWEMSPSLLDYVENPVGHLDEWLMGNLDWSSGQLRAAMVESFMAVELSEESASGEGEDLTDKSTEARSVNGGSPKLTESKADEIRRLHIESGMNATQISSLYGVHRTTISRILRGKAWVN